MRVIDILGLSGPTTYQTSFEYVRLFKTFLFSEKLPSCYRKCIFNVYRCTYIVQNVLQIYIYKTFYVVLSIISLKLHQVLVIRILLP